jgi:tRNA nucleotidyltransferase (CCA-adding enzyme)
MKIYLVGGAVRDKLLGLEIKDRDYVVVGATPEDMVARGFKPVGADFPVFLHPDTKEEYALARTERKSGHGYKGFVIYSAPDVTLEDDLRRRDLTINAMAEEENGEVIDPFDGANDLRAGVLRHVSPAFSEDPVRILRVARFAARYAQRGFKIAPDTYDLMQEIVASGEIDQLIPERVWAETERALSEDQPHHFFQVLRDCDALKRLLPEVDALFGIPQPENYHPEIDTGVHTMMVLQQATRLSTNPQVRFASVMHDVGKGKTPKEEWPSHVGHEECGVAMINALCKRLRVPNDYRDLAILVARHHVNCHRAVQLRASTILKILEGVDAFRRPDRFELFLLACEADARGRKGLEETPYPQADIFRRALEAAAGIDAETVVSKNAALKGAAIGDKIREKRISAIKKVV